MTTQHHPAEQTDDSRTLPSSPPADEPLIDWLDKLPAEQRQRILEAFERGREDPGGVSILVPSPRLDQP